MTDRTLYERLGGYDAISAVANDLLPRLQSDRDMKTSHRGMRISESDWSAFLGHLHGTLHPFGVPGTERDEVVAFVASTKPDIVEAGS